MKILTGGAPLRHVPTRAWPRGAVAALLAVAVLSVTACADDDGGDAAARPDGATAFDPSAGNPDGCIEGVEEGDDVFPDTFDVRHADNLSLRYEGTYKVMTVGEPFPGGASQTYVLVQCGTETPDLDGELSDALVVQIPVQTIFSESTSHLGFIDALGIADRVTGVSDVDQVKMPSIRTRIDADEVVSFRAAGQIDTELVVAEQPDVYITPGTEDTSHQVLLDSDIAVLANAEWLETSPLGWSEWIAFFAALTNTEAAAVEFHDDLVDRYQEAAEMAAAVDERPTVITGGLYQGDWYARGGQGIVPRFIADAGGDYIYADDPSTGSLILDIEEILADATGAEVWLSPLGFATRAEAESSDSRYLSLSAWDEGGVWLNSPTDPSINTPEVGPVMIDHYLLDYIAILHPELVPDHELLFFQPVPAS